MDVVSIFPNEAVCLRLVNAILSEQDENRQIERGRLQVEPIQVQTGTALLQSAVPVPLGQPWFCPNPAIERIASVGLPGSTRPSIQKISCTICRFTSLQRYALPSVRSAWFDTLFAKFMPPCFQNTTPRYNSTQ
jgi:hypothetical protein